MKFFIKKPVLCIVMMLIIMSVGIISFTQLKLRQYPDISKATLTVSIECRDLNTDSLESQVVELLESNLSSLNGIKKISSNISTTDTRIVVEFDLKTDLNVAFIDVVAIINKLKTKLPERANISVIKANVDAKPVVSLCAYSDRLSVEDTRKYVENNLKSHLLSIDGVAVVNIDGVENSQMRIFVDSKKLEFFKLTIRDIAQAIESANLQNLSSGKVVKIENDINISLSNPMETPKQFNEIIIGKSEGGSVVKLKDVGHAEYSTKEEKQLDVKLNDKNVVYASVVSQPNANLIKVSKDVQFRVNEIQERLGDRIKLVIFRDNSEFVEKSIDNVYKAIFEAIILIILTIFLFLRSLRSSMIPIVTIPICLIGTFSIMQFFGFTVNILTLLAIVLAMGNVVDDSIVMLENCYRYIEKGEDPYSASVKGSKEIMFSIIAMTLTLCSVYLPITLVPGITGKIFTEFALTLAGSVVISGFVSLTLSPMMCAYILKKPNHEFKQNTISRFIRYIEKVESNIDKHYSRIIDIIFLNKRYVAAFLTTIVAASVFMFYRIPSSLSQESDTGFVEVYNHNKPTYNLHKNLISMERLKKEIQKKVEGIDQILAVTRSSEYSYFSIKLKKGFKSKEIEKKINKIIKSLPLDFSFTTQSVTENIIESNQKEDSPFGFYILTHKKNSREMHEVALSAMRILREREFDQVDWDLSASSEEKVLKFNYEKAWLMGVRDLSSSFFGDIVKTLGGIELYNCRYNSKDEESRPVVISIGSIKDVNEALESLTVKVYDQVENQHKMIRLSSLFDVEDQSNLVSYKHYNGLRCVKISGKTKGDMRQLYNDIKAQLQKEIPDGYYILPSDELQTFFDESYVMFIIFLLALLFIYLIMSAQFESFALPLIIMFTVPFSIFGSILSMYLSPAGEFNIFSNIGNITLIGLITRHGILIVDFAEKLYADGKSIKESITVAATTRLRPILMTTFAMVLGAVPLAFATGPGYEVRRQLGLVITGGMTIGTLFTIFILPLVYYVFKGFMVKKRQIS